MAAFARDRALPYHLLRRWLQRTGRGRENHSAAAQFQSLPLGSLLGQAWAAEVLSPNGVTVRLSAQVPASLGLDLVALSCQL